MYSLNSKSEKFVLSLQPALNVLLWKKDGAAFMTEGAAGHLASVSGALWRPQGRYFDGADDKILLPDNILNLNRDFTLEMWARPEPIGSGYLRLLCLLDTLNGRNIQVGYDTATFKVFFRYNGTTPYTRRLADTGLSYGKWYHFVWTWSYASSTLQMLVNTLAAAFSENGPTADASQSRIGGYTLGSDSLVHKGLVGEVRAYPRVLTLQETQALNQLTGWRYRT
jgi:hypothetical protein